jgi:regulator of replication initiation timing
MSLFDGIEKFIIEHGSSAILGQQLAFAKEQFAVLERKVSELQLENGKLQAKLEHEQLDRDRAQQELKWLQKEHEEETLIHTFLEFRRGKRTQNKWMAFCPKCHAPAGIDPYSQRAYCAGCAYFANLPSSFTLESVIAQLPP